MANGATGQQSGLLSPTSAILEWNDSPTITLPIPGTFTFRQGNIGRYQVGVVRLAFRGPGIPLPEEASTARVIDPHYSIIAELHDFDGTSGLSRVLPGFSPATQLDEYVLGEVSYNVRTQSGALGFFGNRLTLRFVASAGMPLYYLGDASMSSVLDARMFVWAVESRVPATVPPGSTPEAEYIPYRVLYQTLVRINRTDTPDGPFAPTISTSATPASPQLREHTPGDIKLGTVSFDYSVRTPSGFSGGTMPPNRNVRASSSAANIRTEIESTTPLSVFGGSFAREALQRAQVGVYYTGQGENYETDTSLSVPVSLITPAFPGMRTAAHTATHNLNVAILNRSGDPWPITSGEAWSPRTDSILLREATAGPVAVASVLMTLSSAAGRIPYRPSGFNEITRRLETSNISVSVIGNNSGRYRASVSPVGLGSDRAGNYISGLYLRIEYTGPGETYASNASDNLVLVVSFAADTLRGTAAFSKRIPFTVRIAQTSDPTVIAPPPPPDPDEPDPEPLTPLPEPEDPTTEPDRPSVPRPSGPTDASPKPVRNPYSNVPTSISVQVGQTREFNIGNAWSYRTNSAATWQAVAQPLSRLTETISGSRVSITGVSVGSGQVFCTAADGGQTSDFTHVFAVNVVAADADIGTDSGAGQETEFVPQAITPTIHPTFTFFDNPRLRPVPAGLNAAQNLSTAGQLYGYFVGWFSGSIRTAGERSPVGLTLQGTGAERFRIIDALGDINNISDQSSWNTEEAFRYPIYYVGPGEDREVTKWFNLRVIVHVGGVSGDPATGSSRSSQLLRIPVGEPAEPDDWDALYQLADSAIERQKDLELKKQASHELSSQHAVTVEAILPGSHQTRAGRLAFQALHNVLAADEHVYKVKDPPDMEYQLKPDPNGQQGLGGDLLPYWTNSDGNETTMPRTADYWWYSDTYWRRVFRDEEGDQYWLSLGTLTAPAGQTAADWIAAHNPIYIQSPQPTDNIESYQVIYTANTTGHDRPTGGDITFQQQLIASQPENTQRDTATQQITFKEYNPAPLSCPVAEQQIVIPATTDNQTIDLTRWLANPDGRPLTSGIEAGRNQVQVYSGVAGTYNLSITTLTATRRVINGQKQTNTAGDLLIIKFETGTTLTGGRGPDLGRHIDATLQLRIVWADALPLRALRYTTFARAGALYVDPTGTSNTADLSASLANAGSRPITADFGTRGQRSVDVEGGTLSVEQAANGDWLLRATRAADFPYSSRRTQTRPITLRTTDEFPESSVQMYWRTHIDPPSS